MEGGEGEQVPEAHAATDDLKPVVGEAEGERRDALPGAVTAGSVGVELGNPHGEGDRKRSAAPRKEQDLDSKQGKVFIGGLSWETNEDSLKDYFEKFGKLIDCVIMRDRQTGKPRGFGFVTFAEEADAKAAVQERHELDGREVEAKLAVPRSESNAANNAPRPTKKIFVGGLPHDIRSEDFKDFFTKYGAVEDAQVMIDHRTGNSRGFGFVTFRDEEATENVLGRGSNTTKIDINGKMVEVKRAESRNALSRRGDQQGSDQRGDRRGNSGGAANTSQGQNSMSQGSMQGISPHLAAQYANYYGGTAAVWQQWAAAQAAAAVAAYQQGGSQSGDQTGYGSSQSPSTGAANMYQNLYNNAYGGFQPGSYGTDARGAYGGASGDFQGSSGSGGYSNGGGGRSSGGGGRQGQSRNERYHPYGR